MPASESDRVLAPGIPLTLRDGTTVALRYSMRSLKAFEDTFGSIDDAMGLLNGLLPLGGKPPVNRKIINTVVPLLAIGIEHAGITEDDLLDGTLLDHTKLLSDYFDAIGAAIDQAFPAPGSPGKDDAPEPSSNGVDSTTPQPPALVGATASSGA